MQLKPFSVQDDFKYIKEDKFKIIEDNFHKLTPMKK